MKKNYITPELKIYEIGTSNILQTSEERLYLRNYNPSQDDDPNDGDDMTDPD